MSTFNQPLPSLQNMPDPTLSDEHADIPQGPCSASSASSISTLGRPASPHDNGTAPNLSPSSPSSQAPSSTHNHLNTPDASHTDDLDIDARSPSLTTAQTAPFDNLAYFQARLAALERSRSALMDEVLSMRAWVEERIGALSVTPDPRRGTSSMRLTDDMLEPHSLLSNVWPENTWDTAATMPAPLAMESLPAMPISSAIGSTSATMVEHIEPLMNDFPDTDLHSLGLLEQPIGRHGRYIPVTPWFSESTDYWFNVSSAREDFHISGLPRSSSVWTNTGVQRPGLYGRISDWPEHDDGTMFQYRSSAEADDQWMFGGGWEFE